MHVYGDNQIKSINVRSVSNILAFSSMIWIRKKDEPLHSGERHDIFRLPLPRNANYAASRGRDAPAANVSPPRPRRANHMRGSARLNHVCLFMENIQAAFARD